MMKKHFTLLFTLLILVGFQALSATAQENAPAEIQNYVKKRGGKFPAEVNKYVVGDLNSDGKQDAVVQYYINEGAPGNYYESFIAVFLNKGGKFVFTSEMRAGTKLSAGMVPSGIESGKVAVDTYAANSFEKSGTIYYKLVGRKLVKTK